MYADAWRKAQGAEVLSPLDAQIAKVIEDHPEYIGGIGSDRAPVGRIEPMGEHFHVAAGAERPAVTGEYHHPDVVALARKAPQRL